MEGGSRNLRGAVRGEQRLMNVPLFLPLNCGNMNRATLPTPQLQLLPELGFFGLLIDITGKSVLSLVWKQLQI